MLSVGELITDPDFAQPYSVLRSTGVFALGGFISNTTLLSFYGVITVAQDQDLDTLPEGDRITGSMLFYANGPIYTTIVGANSEGLSDVIAWRGQNYRIAKVFPYVDYGYYKAIGVRMSGE